MKRRNQPLSSIVLLAGLVVASTGAAACGSDDEPKAADRPVAAKSTSVRPGAENLERFLMRDDEQAGFRRVERARTESGVAAFAKSSDLKPADARLLRSAGFVSFTFQPTKGPRTDGVTNVHLFATSKGARSWLAREQRTDVIRGFLPGAEVRRFTVTGVPGARGWTAADVGNLFWVQGRCLLVLGNQGPGPFAAALSAGARAIYRRTSGQCP